MFVLFGYPSVRAFGRTRTDRLFEFCLTDMHGGPAVVADDHLPMFATRAHACCLRSGPKALSQLGVCEPNDVVHVRAVVRPYVLVNVQAHDHARAFGHSTSERSVA